MSDKNTYLTLLKISNELNSIQERSIVLERIMDLAMESLSAERGFILLRNDGSGEIYNLVVARNLSRENISIMRNLSTSIVNRVLQTGRGLFSVDAQTDQRFGNASSVVVQQIKSVICVPLIINKETAGAIYMDSRVSTRVFDENSMEFLEAFAGQAAIALANSDRFEKIQKENEQLKRKVSDLPDIIGQSKPIQNVLGMVHTIADSTASVLIEGESGTGKELIARALHNLSSRHGQAFVPIFCGNISESLLESELFGYKKGAFTGALSDKAGLFEEAHQGTLFLDEIGDVDLNTQAKLLRVIQEGEFKPVGSNQVVKVDVRIVAATNKDLQEAVQSGHFREDLYYRLNVINLKMPPLRERKEDIPLLAAHFLHKFSSRNHKNVHSIAPDALDYLRSYHWPGNIRELENAFERAVILCQGNQLTKDLFELRATEAQLPLGKSLDEINKYAILKTMEMVDQNRTKAAQILGVSRRWLQYKLKEWNTAHAD